MTRTAREARLLAALERLARPLATANKLSFAAYHAQKNPPTGLFNYVGIMVPAPALVAASIAVMRALCSQA